MNQRIAERDRVTVGAAAVGDHLELLAAMGRDFADTRDIDGTLARGLARITQYLNAAGGALFMLEDEGATLRCTACVGATEIEGFTLSSDQGIVGRSVRENRGEIIRDAANDPNFFSSVDEKTGFTTRSILCAPLSVKDHCIGAIELVNKLTRDGLFAESDLSVLQGLCSSAALAIQNARMAEALVEQERVQRELELAAEIQRSLLPEHRHDAYPIHGINCPARVVSGDFFDFFELDDGRICFNLGDVSGKGMNAALMMAKTASLFRCLGKTIHDPAQLMTIINAEICETTTRGMFVTMVGGIFDPATGVVRFSNAGHEPPLFYDRDGTLTSLPAEALPLGISPVLTDDIMFRETELNLNGGTLYIFTDGITEGTLENGDPLETEGVTALIHEHASLDLAERIDAIVAPLNHGQGALRDDLTLLGIDDRERAGKVVDALEEAPAPEETERLLRLEFLSRPNRLRMVRDTTTDAIGLCGCDETVTRDIVLAVDEACQNVIRHAYKGAPDGEIILEIFLTGDTLTLDLRDFAEPVDVEKVRPRSLDDVRPGGLGTHFIREVMDEVDFVPPPSGGGNLLRMLKRLDLEEK